MFKAHRWVVRGVMALMTWALFFAMATPGLEASSLWATTPPLGAADSFGILASTYTNTAAGTTIKGDLGYTTGPAVAPTVTGTTFTAGSAKYSAAGIAQGVALTSLNSQPCTFTFAAGAIDLPPIRPMALSAPMFPECIASPVPHLLEQQE